MINSVINLSSDESGVDEELPDIKTNAIKKKSCAASSRETKKRKVAEDRAAKKKNDELNRVYKPGECMKYMNVEGHPALWACWWCSDVHREVSAAGARVYSTETLVHPAVVVWTRSVLRTINTIAGEVRLSPPLEACPRALYVTSAEDIAELVNARTLASHLGQIRALVDCALTLVVFGVKDYFKSTRRKTSNSNRTHMTEIDLELAITDLLVSTECDTAVVNTPNELALLIVQLTKAIAEAPHKLNKRASDEQAQFYMRGDNKKCVALDKDGIAVGKVWQQMIAMLPHSSLETSRALCAKYPTPLALFECLQSPDSVNEVADIGVSRAAVSGARARRVGIEYARKLKILFTADNGNVLVD